MDDRNESQSQKELGKHAVWKKKGKVSELDRLKKRQKELQIMKLSQEWDARRHKRRMDRIQWLQQRKDHTLPSYVVNENPHTSEESTTEQCDEDDIVPTKANSLPVPTDPTRQLTYEENSIRTVETVENILGPEKPLRKRQYGEQDGKFGLVESESSSCEVNQVYKSVVIKTERQDSEGFCIANDPGKAISSKSKDSSHNGQEDIKRRKKEIQDSQPKKTNIPLPYAPPPQDSEPRKGSPYQRLVTMVSSHLSGQEGVTSPSVIVQAMKQSGLDEEDEDELDDASLLMADEPVRFEDVLRGGGTNIQRLETRTVDIRSKHSVCRAQDHINKTLSSNRSQSNEERKNTRKVEDQNQNYPKIKKCYSLIGHDNKPARSTPLSSTASPGTGSPLMTVASASPESVTVKSEGRFHPVAQAPSTGSHSCPPSGYLVPIYKPSADEVVYAFVPSSGDRAHSRTPDSVKVRPDEHSYHKPDSRFAGNVGGYSSVRAPTATIHHGRKVDPTMRSEHEQIANLRQPTDVTWVNVPGHAVRDKRDYSSMGTLCSNIPVSLPSNKICAHEQVSTSAGLRGDTDIHLHRGSEMVRTTQNSSPVVNVNGYSPIQTAHASEPANNGQALRSSPSSNPPNDSINNPTAIYVRPKLVPREIVVPYKVGSGNVPIVEYIKTDAICDQELVNWTAKNVADFIAATDCPDSAKIFIEQDIDGKAVLLLSQDIFVNRLNLKLGTAIKLYNHISNLRTALLM